MLNTETVIHPKLQHFGLLTGNLQRLLDWYQKVLGMRAIHESGNPTDAPAGSPASRLKAAFISNDEIGRSRHEVARNYLSARDRQREDGSELRPDNPFRGDRAEVARQRAQADDSQVARSAK